MNVRPPLMAVCLYQDLLDRVRARARPGGRIASMSAMVSGPQKLREAVSRKLGRAQECWYHLHQADQPEFNRYTDPAQIVRDFLHAARGVVPVIETFANGRLQRGDFEDWRKSWEQSRLTAARARGLSLRAVATDLANAGHLAPSGRPYGAQSVARMMARD